MTTSVGSGSAAAGTALVSAASAGPGRLPRRSGRAAIERTTSSRIAMAIRAMTTARVRPTSAAWIQVSRASSAAADPSRSPAA